MIWSAAGNQIRPDSRRAFRGEFTLSSPQQIELRITGSSWYSIYLDGKFIQEGPDRYSREMPEYQTIRFSAEAGNHCLAIHHIFWDLKHHRVMQSGDPFLTARVLRISPDCSAAEASSFEDTPEGLSEILMEWKTDQLHAYTHSGRQITPLLGWSEYADLSLIPDGWMQIGFDDSQWHSPHPAEDATLPQEPFNPSKAGSPMQIAVTPELLQRGTLSERYGHQHDDPAYRFFSRLRDHTDIPPDGWYALYDLGHVWPGRPEITVQGRKGWRLEVAYNEGRENGYVTPYIMGGQAYNMDRYILAEGENIISPQEPRGARFIEIHLFPSGTAMNESVTGKHSRLAPPHISVTFLRRSYHRVTEGSFSCNDNRLNHIWNAGAYTHISCSEDALVDNPTRERGQWTGDAANVGMEVAGAAFNNLGLIRKALIEAAESADEHGMVAAMSTGYPVYITSFALQWIRACVRYHEISGDISVLHNQISAAEANFSRCYTAHLDGNLTELSWNFLDWGYETPDWMDSDMSLQAFLADGAAALSQWCERIGDSKGAGKYRKLADKLFSDIRIFLSKNNHRLEELGYHLKGLLLRFELIEQDKKQQIIDQLKQHISDSFPLNLQALRLGGPETTGFQFITPYFTHFIFPALIENGQAEWVYRMISDAWGWVLDEGLTTMPEVFDLRWSHSHQWSASPTWILSRYALGFKKRFDLGHNHFVFSFEPGDLSQCNGTIPLVDGGEVHITWSREKGHYIFSIQTNRDISIGGIKPGEVVVEAGSRLSFSISKGVYT